MVDKNKEIRVSNRGGSVIAYVIPEMRIKRHFSPQETKTITFEELQSLYFTDGGRELISNNLIIRDEEALKALFPNYEPEYKYGREEIKILLKEKSLDALLDCLDFAPDGVLDLVKNIAVEIELNDFSKRNAIKEKLNFDVTRAIEIKNTKYDGGDPDNGDTSSKPKRRVSVDGASSQPTAQKERRTSTVIVKDSNWSDRIVQ